MHHRESVLWIVKMVMAFVITFLAFYGTEAHAVSQSDIPGCVSKRSANNIFSIYPGISPLSMQLLEGLPYFS